MNQLRYLSRQIMFKIQLTASKTNSQLTNDLITFKTQVQEGRGGRRTQYP